MSTGEIRMSIRKVSGRAKMNLVERDFFIEGMFSVRMKPNWKRLRTHATAGFSSASLEQNNLKKHKHI
jgi:hypothetical protein